MKMKKCKYCGKDIAKNVKKCPHCGGKYGIPGWAKVLIVLAIIIFCIIGCTAGCTKGVSDALDEVTNGYDDINGKKSFNVGDNYESKYLKISFTYNDNFKEINKYATVKEGYKIVEFKFKAENIGKEDQVFDYTDFNCYADGEKMQQFYSVEGSGLDSGGKISSGKTSTVPVYCEVPTEAEKITTEYKPMLADNNYEFIGK